MVEVLCIGHSAYDITLPMAGFPIENQKYRIDKKIEGGGGPASNAAYLLSKWGINTAYIGVLGDDIYGEKIVEEFNSVGTDISLVDIKKDYHTPYSTILVNTIDGSRTIINFNEGHKKSKISIEKLRKLNPSIMLFDGHELEISLQAMELFPNSKTILDAGSVREGTIELSKKVDYLITSEDFALEISQMDKLDGHEDYMNCINEMREYSKGQIVVTLGERGLIFENKGKVEKVDAYAVDAIDTTGAGDIFHGAFAYGLSKGYTLKDNLKFSSLASAISVRTLGGRQSIPNLPLKL